MSATSRGKRRAAETLDALERQASEDEMDRILALGDAELDAELASAGFDPTAERAKGARMAERARGKVVPLPAARRPSRLVWLMAAGFALLAGAVAATQGPAVVAWLKGGPPEPIRPANEPPRPLSPHEIAEKARDAAEKACAEELWGRCIDRLDEAREIDPAGESEERVQKLRQDIHDGTTLKPGPPDKPGRK